jgi:hypothetical protein
LEQVVLTTKRLDLSTLWRPIILCVEAAVVSQLEPPQKITPSETLAG